MSIEQSPAAGRLGVAEALPKVANKRVLRILVPAAGAILAIAIALAMLLPKDDAGAAADLTAFKIRPISFPVVLKEKGEVKAKESVDVRCEVDGESTILWLIPEGTVVKEGDLLVELESKDIDDRVRQKEIEVADLTAGLESAQRDYEIQLDENTSNIRKAELKLRLAKLELEKYQKGEYKKQLTEAQLGINIGKEKLRRAQDDCKSSEKLHEQGYITMSDLEDDKFSLYAAEVDLEKAELSLKILQDYTYPAALSQKEADVTEAEKELVRTSKRAEDEAASKLARLESQKAKLEIRQKQLEDRIEQRENCKIHAPAPGMVVYSGHDRWWRDDNISEGSKVYKNREIIELPDTSVMQVEVKVHESKIEKLKIGHRAAVTIEGVPDKTFLGTVTKIAPLASTQNRWLNPDIKEFETEITLDEANPELKPNATAEVEIVIDYLDDVLAVPVQAIYGFGGENYVFAKSGRGVEPVNVELGAASTEYVELLDGPKKGREVMMTITDDMKQMLAATEEGEKNGNGLNTDESMLRTLAATSRPVTQPSTQPSRPTTTQATSAPTTRQAATTQPADTQNDQQQEKLGSAAEE
jgi:HlyD family secretion protein